MKAQQLHLIVKQNGLYSKDSILTDKYKPNPVRRLDIHKPDGAITPRGIRTILVRLIQQAIAQVLTGIFDTHFSENSFGFRPGRSAHDAAKQAKEYMNQGYEYVVDMDIEKFFDKVNHDILMHKVSKRIKDKRVLKLI